MIAPEDSVFKSSQSRSLYHDLRSDSVTQIFGGKMNEDFPGKTDHSYECEDWLVSEAAVSRNFGFRIARDLIFVSIPGF